MNHNTLKSSIRILGPMIGEDLGIKVVFESGAYTTPDKKIAIPNPPMTEDGETVAFGHLFHEGNHQLFTDFDAIRQASTPIEKGILNALEDAWVDGKGAVKYPGSKIRRQKLVKYLLDNGSAISVREDQHPAEMLKAYILLRLYTDLRGYEACRESADQGEALIRKNFPSGAVTRLHGLMYQVDASEDSFGNLNLTRKIITMLKEEEEKAQQQSQPQPQDQSQDGDSDSGDSSDDSQQQQSGSDGDSQPDSGDSNSSGDSQEGGEGTSTNGQGNGSSDQNANSDSDGQSAPSDSNAQNTQSNTDGANANGSGGTQSDSGDQSAISKALSAGANDIGQDLGEITHQLLEGMGRDAGESMPMEIPLSRNDSKQQMPQLLAQARVQTMALRRNLVSMLQAQAQVRNTVSETGRRLSSRHIHRIAADNGSGTVKVFRTRVDSPAVNTAVFILADMSTSMKGGRAEVARSSCMAVSAALEQVQGVKVAVASFNDDATLICDFNEKPSQVTGRFGEMFTAGCTAMDGALLHAARALLAQREPRKICLILSDGEPNSNASVETLVPLMEQSGIECMAIGIMHPAVAGLFKQHTIINRVEELPGAMFNMLKGVMLKAA